MRSAYLLLIPTLLLLLAFPVSRGRYNDDFDDGEDLADFDDNDFAEFEDMNDELAAETETAPPPRANPSSQPEEDEDEDEATVELEDGQDGFEDSDNPVCCLFYYCVLACLTFDQCMIITHTELVAKLIQSNFSAGSRHIQQI